jgi:teichuronic acid biosynthesis glycosyltransferase TuaC
MRVMFVIPGEARGHSMIFARRQAEILRAEGVEVETFYLESRTSPAALARELVRFRRLRRRVRPDVIHAQFGTMTALFAAVASVPTPLVITYRGSDLNPSHPWSLRSATGRLLSQIAALRAARIVCVSRQLRERLWWRRPKAAVMPTGVDLEVFFPEARSAARSRLGWAEADRVVLFNAGREQSGKRLDLAAAAVTAARRWLVVLCPAGLASRRAEPRLRLEVMNGSVPPERVPWLMSAADCLLVTSDAEGSPTVVQEALASNLPVVSVAAGDAPERLAGVRHTLIVARDPEALGAALAGVVARPERSDGRSKSDEFSARAIARRLHALYQEIA